MRVCGLDEVGRGSLAGPLVAAATVLNVQCSMFNLRDSKKLNKQQRERIFKELMEAGVEYEIEIISARQINSRGMGWANKEIFKNLVKKIEADKYIVDGSLKIKVRKKNIKSVVKADTTRKCVMAASIIAKVTRDLRMRELHDLHKIYGWDKNVGYGTKKHVEAIMKYGTCKYHRDVWVTTVMKRVEEMRVEEYK